ncbi:hypothetical protein Misp01_67870 [Microtetraspora sp. NBRC 13810]|uniref:hypothetical protein n=1 Tax=Microtetraspora sp. NBRC 13810 TaxID=3030990 RepID=UPI0024A08A13|nr:hypothetical protein [Microtetraspora sp. NBRC 13810]GLW11659.1 hypothetical protein Misp01_67870 [Microtetraspora sp. NBRC 13810]
MTPEQKEALKKDLESSINVRKIQESLLGRDHGHAERLRQEQSLLRRLTEESDS